MRLSHFPLVSLTAVLFCCGLARGQNDAEHFPRFIVPKHEKPVQAMNDLFAKHYKPVRLATLWLQWTPMSTLWVDDNGPAAGHQSAEVVRNWLNTTIIDEEGYIATHQHRGLAHSKGWPFPLYAQAGSRGWVFNTKGQPYGPKFGIHPTRTTERWKVDGAQNFGLIAEPRTWLVTATQDNPSITTPKVAINSFVSPFVRLYFRCRGPREVTIKFQWATHENPQFDDERMIKHRVVVNDKSPVYADIPCYRHDLWSGRTIQWRFTFEGVQPGHELHFYDIVPAMDSRHNINNSMYIIGCSDYLRWTGDQEFLRQNIVKMRRSLKYMIDEFDIIEQGCVSMSWVGHGGRTGIVWHEDGKKSILHGRGVGNNYWDLLPFGGKDALGTMYYLDAARRMLEIEKYAKRIKGLPIDGAFEVAWLEEHIEHVTTRSRAMFWNKDTGRFIAAEDIDGNRHDYGYTFVNFEAIYFGLADKNQSKSILDWVNGRRVVESDTSTGEDIYTWRFGPRSSTKRNIEWYGFMWAAPESIPYGDQVQDGGAVLGFSYHDLMARIKVEGPNSAAERLNEIAEWFGEVQAAGGYRKYYKDNPGTLQGNSVPGGLGMDAEFFESVLVPQVMLYGFMGVQPRMDRLIIDPRLPDDWPQLKITNVAFRGGLLDLIATKDSIEIEIIKKPTGSVGVTGPSGKWRMTYFDAQGIAGRSYKSTDENGQPFMLPLVCGKRTKLVFHRVK